MKTIFVGWQDPSTREWVPVARLRRELGQYLLNYTKGAGRAAGFAGFARMNDLGATYASDTLFPFFANRLVNPQRSDYRQYCAWLGLSPNAEHDPLEVLALTGGARETDSFEVIPAPQRQGERLRLNFFVRGLKYSLRSTIDHVSKMQSGVQLFLMRDIQNPVDAEALTLRSESPSALIGYVPRYYSAGLSRLLNKTRDVHVNIVRVNVDAPMDLRLLCSLDASWPTGFHLLESNHDFLEWSASGLPPAVSLQLG